MTCLIPFRFLPTLCVRVGRVDVFNAVRDDILGADRAGTNAWGGSEKSQSRGFWSFLSLLVLLIFLVFRSLICSSILHLIFIWFCYSWGWPKTWCSLWQPFLGQIPRDTNVIPWYFLVLAMTRRLLAAFFLETCASLVALPTLCCCVAAS
jgi:hypothetical protein